MLSRIFFPASRTSASQGNQKRKEGEVTIDYVEKKNTKKDSDKGDYVEYEEVD